MAASKQYCESCKEIFGVQQPEKIIKCGNKRCVVFLHHICSPFKATEIKFLETYKQNIKWYCSGCLKNENQSLGDVITKVNDMEKKMIEVFEYVKNILLKIDNQNEIIQNLKKKEENIEDRNNVIQKSASEEEIRKEENTQNQSNVKKPTNERDNRKICTRSQTTEGAPKVTQQPKTGTDKDKPKETQAPKNKSDETKTVNKDEKHIIKAVDTINIRNTEPAKNIRGTNKQTTLATVENRKWVFVSNFVNKTKEIDIQKHLEAYNITALVCKKLDIKNTDIAAFKLAIREEDVSRVYDANIWPQNAIVRDFRNFRKKASTPALLTSK